jgi:sulfur carrier protein ThiS
VNGVVVPRDQYRAHPVPDGANVECIHLISGG